MATYVKDLVAIFGATWAGKVGQVGVQVKDASGNVLIARTTSNITEDPASSGIYKTYLTFDCSWYGSIAWDINNTTPYACEDFTTYPVLNAGLMQHDLTQAVPTSNTGNTVGDCLNAARAQGFGKWTLVGTTLTLYAPDGTTVVRTFTLDSASAPTQRV